MSVEISSQRNKVVKTNGTTPIKKSCNNTLVSDITSIDEYPQSTTPFNRNNTNIKRAGMVDQTTAKVDKRSHYENETKHDNGTLFPSLSLLSSTTGSNPPNESTTTYNDDNNAKNCLPTIMYSNNFVDFDHQRTEDTVVICTPEEWSQHRRRLRSTCSSRSMGGESVLSGSIYTDGETFINGETETDNENDNNDNEKMNSIVRLEEENNLSTSDYGGLHLMKKDESSHTTGPISSSSSLADDCGSFINRTAILKNSLSPPLDGLDQLQKEFLFIKAPTTDDRSIDNDLEEHSLQSTEFVADKISEVHSTSFEEEDTDFIKVSNTNQTIKKSTSFEDRLVTDDDDSDDESNYRRKKIKSRQSRDSKKRFEAEKSGSVHGDTRAIDFDDVYEVQQYLQHSLINSVHSISLLDSGSDYESSSIATGPTDTDGDIDPRFEIITAGNMDDTIRKIKEYSSITSRKDIGRSNTIKSLISASSDDSTDQPTSSQEKDTSKLLQQVKKSRFQFDSIVANVVPLKTSMAAVAVMKSKQQQQQQQQQPGDNTTEETSSKKRSESITSAMTLSDFSLFDKQKPYEDNSSNPDNEIPTTPLPKEQDHSKTKIKDNHIGGLRIFLQKYPFLMIFAMIILIVLIGVVMQTLIFNIILVDDNIFSKTTAGSTQQSYLRHRR